MRQSRSCGSLSLEINGRAHNVGPVANPSRQEYDVAQELENVDRVKSEQSVTDEGNVPLDVKPRWLPKHDRAISGGTSVGSRVDAGEQNDHCNGKAELGFQSTGNDWIQYSISGS